MRQMAKRPRKEMSGFMDFFLPKRQEGTRRSIFEAFTGRPPEPESQPLPALPAPGPRGGPLVPRPEQAPVPVRPSIFEFAAPKPVVQEPEKPSIFSSIPPSAPPPPPSAPPAAATEQESFWAGMFAPESERPVEQFFGQAQPEERPPRWVPVSVYRQTVSWQHIWPFPTVEQLLQSMRRIINLPEIFSKLQASRETLEFWQQMEESAQQGQPVLLRIAPIVHQELYTDLSKFFGVPTAVFDYYMDQARTPEEEREAFARLWHEVISPLIFAMQEAFESITPANIPGWFTIVVDERTGEYWLCYVEAYMPPPPPAGLTYGGEVG